MPLDAGAHDTSSLSGTDISSLVKLFTGTSGKSSDSSSSSTQNSGAVSNTGTTTTGTSMSQGAMDAMLKSILEQTQGLASTAMGEHSAGLYNSSTNTLLQNDLMTRAAAQVAQNTKTSTTTQNTAQTDTRGSTTSGTDAKTNSTAPPVAPGTAAKGAAALAGVNAISKFLPAGAGTSLVNKIKNSIGIGNGANTADIAGAKIGAANANTEAADLASVYPASSPAISNADIGSVSGPISDASDIDFSGASDVSNAISSIGSVDTSSIGDFSDMGGEAASGAVNAGADIADNISENIADGFMDAGSAASDAFGGFDWGSIFAADGGMITDPNRPDGPNVVSNLDFAQHNPVAVQVAQAIRSRSSIAGYADGGAVSDAPVKSESIFDRRRAAIDAAESGTVQGTDTNKSYQDRMGQQSAEPKKDSGASGFIPSIRKVLHLANGGAVGFFDDGGHVDLTNLGLRVQPSNTRAGSGLAALNAPDSADSDTSGGAVTGPLDQGTGFANTSNQALTSAITPTTRTTSTPSKKSTSPANGNTAQPANGESNSSAPGTAQGGIDSSPNAVSNAAIGLGLAAIGLSALSPIAIGLNNAMSAPGDDASTNAAAPEGTVGMSVGTGMSVGIGQTAQGNMSVAPGPSASESLGLDGPAADSDSTDGGDSDSAGDGVGAGNSAGDGNSGDGGTGAGDGGSASAADGGLISMIKSYFKGGPVIGPSDNSGDDDAIPAKLTNNEFVVNPEATARFRPLLEMMNNAVRAQK